jgi:ribosomal protein L37AE/L43A
MNLPKLWVEAVTKYDSWLDRITYVGDAVNMKSEDVVRVLLHEKFIGTSELVGIYDEYERKRGNIVSELASGLGVGTSSAAVPSDNSVGLSNQSTAWLNVVSADPMEGEVVVDVRGRSLKFEAAPEVIDRFLKYQPTDQDRAYHYLRTYGQMVSERFIPDAYRLVDAVLHHGDLEGVVSELFEGRSNPSSNDRRVRRACLNCQNFTAIQSSDGSWFCENCGWTKEADSRKKESAVNEIFPGNKEDWDDFEHRLVRHDEPSDERARRSCPNCQNAETYRDDNGDWHCKDCGWNSENGSRWDANAGGSYDIFQDFPNESTEMPDEEDLKRRKRVDYFTIEQSHGQTYGDDTWAVYGHGEYEATSVMAGKPKRVYVEGGFATPEEAQAKYPFAEFYASNYSSHIDADELTRDIPDEPDIKGMYPDDEW